MVTPSYVKDADVRFTSWLCRRSREQPSYEHTCESHRTAWNLGGSPRPDHQHVNRLTHRPRLVGRQLR